MIPNIINTIVGLVLVYATVLHQTWIEQRYFPLAAFAVVMLILALWARASDAHPWFSNVNIVLAVALGLFSLLPLATWPELTFWAGLWVGVLVPTIALWAVFYRPHHLLSSGADGH